MVLKMKAPTKVDNVSRDATAEKRAPWNRRENYSRI